MGEAKRRRAVLKERVFAQSRFCIYCGGATAATTIDHCPPACIFDRSHRPSGLEFPACGACNYGGRLDELAAAMLSRIYPDPTTDDGRREVKRFINETSNNWPGLLVEMLPSRRQLRDVRRLNRPEFVHALNCRGPLLNRAIQRFGAKIGFALHFELLGRPVPSGGAAAVWWFTNERAVAGEMPTDLIEMLGAVKTLRQGKWHVGEQFSYQSQATEDGSEMSAHFATFRFSFAVCAFVAADANRVRPPAHVDHFTLVSPGWLQRSG